MNKRGQINVAGAAVLAIIGVIGIIIFASVYDALNTALVSNSAVTLLNLVDLLLASVLVIGVVGLLVFFGRGR